MKKFLLFIFYSLVLVLVFSTRQQAAFAKSYTRGTDFASLGEILEDFAVQSTDNTVLEIILPTSYNMAENPYLIRRNDND